MAGEIIKSGLVAVPRPKSISITGRYCALCREPAVPALVLELRGLLSETIAFCTRCVVRCCHELAQHRDAVLNLDVEPRHARN